MSVQYTRKSWGLGLLLPLVGCAVVAEEPGVAHVGQAVDGVLTGTCRANANEASIDDFEDGDHLLAKNDGRLGVWYTFNPGAPCVQTPVVDRSTRFAATAGGANGTRFAGGTVGTACKSAAWSGGGLGVQFLASYDAKADEPTACAAGYDASAFGGLAFSVRSRSALRVQVCTKDVTDSNCHGYDVSATGTSWQAVTIPWVQLLQEDWGPTTKRVPFEPSKLVSVQFKATQAEFDFTIDDVKFLEANSSGKVPTGTAKNFAPRVGVVSQAFYETEYQRWKARHFVACSDGSADVRKEGSQAVSEGTGYGMLLAVLAGDRPTFDALAKGFEKRRNGLGMMSWNFSVCGGSQDSGGATDGDLDIAMALILADAKWGGYRTQAEVLISALKQYATASCDGRRVLRPGDRWGSCADNVDKRLNPSYFSPAYYRAFAAYVPNQADFWNGLVDDTYALLAVYQQRMSGLLPDWSYSDGSTAGAYGYEACRVPWRIATDYAWSGDVRAKTLLQGLRSWAATRGGPGQAASEKNSCFVGGFALTALAEGQAEADAWFASWLSAIPQGPDPSMGDNPYYQGTLRPLYMAVAGGLFLPPFAVK